MLAACGKLSSPEAQRLVAESGVFKEVPTATLFEGHATRGGDPLYAGLVDMRLVAIHPGPAARLTRLGQQRIEPWSAGRPGQYTIPFATGRRITSVRVANLNGTTADAEVRWTYDLTDIGQSIANRDTTDQYRLKGEHVERATFTKYDDGWRLEGLAPK